MDFYCKNCDSKLIEGWDIIENQLCGICSQKNDRPLDETIEDKVRYDISCGSELEPEDYEY